ncbi:hypothetical protein [Nocardioides sp. Soil805]|uniref:hypothetical protein n=1 Tax=Nocardioides sp. Soil805 TaxID=1736416 RepID=UPI0007032C94|nr:hypothetical protein [Nocardioides sp. Soil805]KRF36651.1 hypothetical protein ASG94_04280 [Nocardioides sp. Soil805]
MNSPRLEITETEKPRLVEAMRDIQEGVAAYYAETALRGDLGGHVRTWLGRVQTLNDLLTNQLADRASYTALFDPPKAPGVDLINAAKYARNIDQHVMHIVAPSTDSLIGGGTFGYRVYAQWEPVPPAAHASLRPGTQALEPTYSAELQGQEVTSTMLGVLRFFADIAPQIVHRDPRGEWTGFPLMSQPAVGAPLHPEEPIGDIPAANAWLNSRRPNGDTRVVCGQLTKDDTAYLFGFTFIGQLSFAPFVETTDQVDRDIAAGFPYLQGQLERNVQNVTEKFPQARQGAVLHSPNDVTTWATPIIRTKQDEDWLPAFGVEQWSRMVTAEHPGVFPDFVAYSERRARRLNALVPPR